MQVAIEPIAQVTQHLLAKSVGEHGLPHAEDRRPKCYGQHDQRERDDQPEVGSRTVVGKEALIEDPLDQQGVDDADDRTEQNEHGDADGLTSMRCEESSDPPPAEPLHATH
ncbi:MAG: hypothetical protein ACI8TP_002089 [Acidimicrobiales bacterium]